MRIVECYSHLNGLEFLRVHQAVLWSEIQEVIESADSSRFKTKVSKEKTKLGELLYAPKEMNKAIGKAFKERGWAESRTKYWVTKEARLIRRTMHMSFEEQKREIIDSGEEPIYSYNQTDFVKNRIAVEVQFGKYTYVAFDLFVKHMAFYVGDVIDVGVEILPMKELKAKMSTGIGYYEKELYNLIRQGRGTPAVPLVIVGVGV